MTGAPRTSDVEALHTFAPGPMAPREARQWITPLLGAGVTPGATNDIMLVVSELVTNAVVHGAGPVRLRVRCGLDSVRIEVSDDGGGSVVPRETDPEATGGRGLLVVDHLAQGWGVVDNHLGGKTVWVELGLA